MELNKKKSTVLAWVYNVTFLTISISNILGFKAALVPYIVLSRLCLFMYIILIAMMIIMPILIEISEVAGNTITIRDNMESFGLSITKKITIQGFILLAITVAIFAINKQYELVALVIISKFSGKITKDLYGKRLAEIIERGGIW